MNGFWKTLVVAVGAMQLLLTYWLWRASAWLTGLASSTYRPFGETGLGDPMFRGLVLPTAALVLLVLVLFVRHSSNPPEAQARTKDDAAGDAPLS